VGFLVFVISLVAGVAALCGQEAVFWNGRPVFGWEGLLMSMADFPIATCLLALIPAWAFYLERTAWPAFKRRIRRLFRRM
jgi:hypothetical protein